MEALTQTCNSFYFSSYTPQEVSNLIKKLKTNKAKRTSDIETRFVNYASPVISVFLSKLINSCVSDGMYLNLLKVAEVISILKMVVAIELPITVLYHFFLNSTKSSKKYCTIPSIRIRLDSSY